MTKKAKQIRSIDQIADDFSHGLIFYDSNDGKDEPERSGYIRFGRRTEDGYRSFASRSYHTNWGDDHPYSKKVIDTELRRKLFGLNEGKEGGDRNFRVLIRHGNPRINRGRPYSTLQDKRMMAPEERQDLEGFLGVEFL